MGRRRRQQMKRAAERRRLIPPMTFYLSHQPELNKMPCLDGFPFVTLQDYVKLTVYVKGRRQEAMIDSGNTHNNMSHKVASSLGLLEHITKRKILDLALWNDNTKVEVGIIRKLPVHLENGIELVMNFHVYPVGFHEKYRHLHEFMINNDTMRRYNVTQTFGKNGSSTLYFKHDDLPVKRRNLPLFMLEVHVRKDLSDSPLRVMIDTGADRSFHISPKCIGKLNKDQNDIKDTDFRLDFGNGEEVSMGVAEILHPHVEYDFIIGVNGLAQHGCHFDYSDFKLYFQKNEKVLQAMFLQ